MGDRVPRRAKQPRKERTKEKSPVRPESPLNKLSLSPPSKQASRSRKNASAKKMGPTSSLYAMYVVGLYSIAASPSRCALLSALHHHDAPHLNPTSRMITCTSRELGIPAQPHQLRPHRESCTPGITDSPKRICRPLLVCTRMTQRF